MRLRTLHVALIPCLFFGYALLVNVVLLLQATPGQTRLNWDVSAARASIDQLYSDQQLHRTFAQAALGALRYAVLREGREGVRVAPEGWLFSAEEFRAPLAEAKAQALRADIVQLAQQAQRQGARIVVLLLPTKAESLGLTGLAALEQEKQRLITDLRHGHVAFLDAAPALRGAGSFFKTDTHWTPMGATATAELLATSFPALSGEAEVETVHENPDIFHGDLIPFVTSAAFAPMLGLAAEEVAIARATVNSGGEMDLFSGPKDAHVLVGTSYSANPRWGFEDALKRALRRDVLNYASIGQGPLAPMRAFLQDPERPKTATVIWEIPVRYLTDPALVESAQ